MQGTLLTVDIAAGAFNLYNALSIVVTGVTPGHKQTRISPNVRMVTIQSLSSNAGLVYLGDGTLNPVTDFAAVLGGGSSYTFQSTLPTISLKSMYVEVDTDDTLIAVSYD